MQRTDRTLAVNHTLQALAILLFLAAITFLMP
jgi:hypothetical protein